TISPSDEFEDNSNVPHLTYLQIFIIFLKFGFQAFGGPMAQIALIKEELVTKQAWITHARFNRVFGVYQIIPGPEAMELAQFFGYLAGGRFGGLLGGLGFLLPGFALVLLFSYIYVAVGLRNKHFNASFRALQPIVAAMMMRAVNKIGEHALMCHKTKTLNYWLFSLAFLSAIQSAFRVNYFITLFGIGLIYMIIDRKYYWVAGSFILLEVVGYVIYVVFKGFPSPLSFGLGITPTPDPGHIFALGLVSGSLSFGGAYTTIPIIQAEAVTIGKWLSPQSFLDMIAIGNIMPAPLVMFSTGIGFQAGYIYKENYGYAFLEGTLISIGIVFPCFVFTIMGHHLLEKLVQNKLLAAFFEGISAAVVGVVAITALELLKTSITTSLLLRDVSENEKGILL
ncbi:5573_t:CDS:2, partial [Ambispora gerdemannii]